MSDDLSTADLKVQHGDSAAAPKQADVDDRTTRPQPAKPAGSEFVSTEPSVIVPVRPAGLWCPPGYEIERELGRGGMGVVYQARRLSDGETVALKCPRADRLTDELLERASRESDAASRLDHPNVVKVLETGTHEDQPFIVMELLRGGHLGERIGPHGIGRAAAVDLVATLADAVQALHDASILHRDLKPGNVMFDDAGTLKLTDFGLAKQLDSDPLTTQGGAGTPAYMSPEQFGPESAKVGPAVDVYALGAILFESLTGRPPFEGTSNATVRQQVLNRPASFSRKLSAVAPRDLREVCLKCLEKSPHRRYATAAELAEKLRSHRDTGKATGAPLGIERRFRQAAHSVPVRYFGFVGTVLATALVALLVSLGNTPELAVTPPPGPRLIRPDPNADRKKAEADLAAGRLYRLPEDPKAAKRVIRWHLDQGTVEAYTGEGGGLRIGCPTFAAAEVVADPGRDHFRIDVEIKHYTQYRPISCVGLYVGDFEVPGSPNEHRCLYTADFFDYPPRPFQSVALRARLISRGEHGRCSPHIANVSGAPPFRVAGEWDGDAGGPWRHLSIEVSLTAVTVSLPGQADARPPAVYRKKDLNVASIRAATNAPRLQTRNSLPGWQPRRGVGIYVHGGVALVRKLTITPLEK